MFHCAPFYFHEWLWSNQHTIPLLFDDCMTLLEKLQALWCKLNELIDDYNQFKDDFNEWKIEVENTLKEIQQTLVDLQNQINVIEARVSALESKVLDLQNQINNIRNDISQIQQNLTNLTTRVSNIETNLSNLQQEFNTLKNSVTNIDNQITGMATNIDQLSDRITAIENQLKALKIVVPQELFKENDMQWFMENVASPYLSALGLPATDIISDRIYTGDNAPAVSFKVGYLGFPIVYLKFPFIIDVQSHGQASNITDSTLTQHSGDVARVVSAIYRQFSKAGLFTDINLYNAPDFEITDEMKFPASYMLAGTETYMKVPHRASVEFNTVRFENTTSTQLDFRFRLTRGSKNAGLAFQGLPVAYYGSWDYITPSNMSLRVAYIAEHQ